MRRASSREQVKMPKGVQSINALKQPSASVRSGRIGRMENCFGDDDGYQGNKRNQGAKLHKPNSATQGQAFANTSKVPSISCRISGQGDDARFTYVIWHGPGSINRDASTSRGREGSAGGVNGRTATTCYRKPRRYWPSHLSSPPNNLTFRLPCV